MLATIGDPPLVDERLAYEPKYDGVRAIVEIEPRRGPRGIRIWSRGGNDKTAQFADVAHVLGRFAARLKRRVVLDGEIVALDARGEVAGFQHLQGRVHARVDVAVGRAAFIAFDVLRDGTSDLRRLPLTARRARLERIVGSAGSEEFRLSTFVAGDGRELYRQAVTRGWEGLVVKRLDAPYASGRRSPDWTKLKLVGRQQCVVGGWTEPRYSRTHFGALLLGVYDGGVLEYIGHTGTGFTMPELARLSARLAPLETAACPFARRPRTNARPHWVRPELVVDIQFSEWTRDARLRAPVYLGLRPDADPHAVHREPFVRRDIHAAGPDSSTDTEMKTVRPEPPARHASRALPPKSSARRDVRALRREPPARRDVRALPPHHASAGRGLPPDDLIDALHDLERRRAGGVVTLPDGARLEVTNLAKVLWPDLGVTKGELMRYYVTASPWILPVVADRPLVMKRFPNGIRGTSFYQQRAPGDVPPGVRVEVVPGDTEVPSRLVGGSLTTLLYMAQLAVVSQDPWFSRVGAPDHADHVALDLDPMPGVTFSRVLDVARWIRDVLAALGVPSVPKTSGADGVHIYIPMPAGTSYESGRLFCQIVATLVADRHPAHATVERAVHARGRTVYIDYLQNIRGKTLAAAYSVRATDFAGVSAPLTWDEIDRGVDRRDFTIRTMFARVAAAGDLWAAVRASAGADLRAVLAHARGGHVVDTTQARAMSPSRRSDRGTHRSA